jgi:hypothetical protein
MPATLTTQSPIRSLAKVLDEADFATFVAAADQENPIDQLFVAIGQDSQSRDIVMSMVYINDLSKSMEVQEDEDDAILLQYFVAFPFVAAPQCIGQASSLVLSLNRLLPIGAFGLNVKDGSLYCQYVLALDERQVSEKITLETTSMLSMFCLQFTQQLEAVASGQKTYLQVLGELSEQGITIPGINDKDEATGSQKPQAQQQA